MRFILKGPFKENIYSLLRQLGYRFQGKNVETPELSFIRSLERGGYPRFHLFLKENPETQEITFNLHLDQKRPIYKETTAHSGEYEGEVAKKEAERIKQIISTIKLWKLKFLKEKKLK